MLRMKMQIARDFVKATKAKITKEQKDSLSNKFHPINSVEELEGIRGRVDQYYVVVVLLDQTVSASQKANLLHDLEQKGSTSKYGKMRVSIPHKTKDVLYLIFPEGPKNAPLKNGRKLQKYRDSLIDRITAFVPEDVKIKHVEYTSDDLARRLLEQSESRAQTSSAAAETCFTRVIDKQSPYGRIHSLADDIRNDRNVHLANQGWFPT